MFLPRKLAKWNGHFPENQVFSFYDLGLTEIAGNLHKLSEPPKALIVLLWLLGRVGLYFQKRKTRTYIFRVLKTPKNPSRNDNKTEKHETSQKISNNVVIRQHTWNDFKEPSNMQNPHEPT